MTFTKKRIFGLLKETFAEWKEDKSLKLGAALAYYTIFSLPPLLLIVIAVAGMVFGQQAVKGQIVAQFQQFVGKEHAQIIQTMVQHAALPKGGIIATVIGAVMLVLGATGVFGELQDSLNIIWKVKPKPDAGFKHVITTRLLSFSLILSIAFLLLVSLVVSAAVSAFGSLLNSLWSGPPIMEYVVQVVNFILSFGIITLLFAMLFKILPDAEIAWSDVWLGAAVTALLFTIGKTVIGIYLGKSNMASAYGAAGSMIILLLWVYYSSQILFFGAEFTQVYANRYGTRILPSRFAAPLEKSSR